PTDLYALSLHDALPICSWLAIRLTILGRATALAALLALGAASSAFAQASMASPDGPPPPPAPKAATPAPAKDSFGVDVTLTAKTDRKSTRLNSSHVAIS